MDDPIRPPTRASGTGSAPLLSFVQQSADSWPYLGIAVVLTVLALVIMTVELTRWTAGARLPESVLWAPVCAFSAWVTAERRSEWSSRAHTGVTIAAWALAAYFACASAVYWSLWYSHGRSIVDLLLAAFGAVVMAVGSWRRQRELPRS